MNKINKIDESVKDKIATEVEKIHSFLYKEYLYHLKDDYIIGDYSKSEPVKIDERPYGLRVTSWVERLEKKDELLGDKFKNIFAAFNNTGATLAMLVARKDSKCEFYFFVSSKDKKNQKRSRDLLSDIIQSNFPGSSVKKYEPKKDMSVNAWLSERTEEEQRKGIKSAEFNIDEILNEKNTCSVVALTAVATEKSEKFISQGLEKLFDVPGKEDFSILILSKSLTQTDVANVKNGYETLGTEISPYAVTQNSKGDSTSESLAQSESKAHTHGINESITNTIGGSISGTVGGSSGVSVGIPGIASVSQNVNYSVTVGFNYSHAKTKGFSDSDTTSTGTINTTANTITENTILTITDYQIKDSVDKIQEQIKRLDVGKALGLWQTAAYIYAKEPSVAENVANVYKGIIQGEKSFIEPCVVNEWNWIGNNDKEKSTCQNILKAIKNFEHPVFFHINDMLETDENGKFKLDDKGNPKFKESPDETVAKVTPAVFVNTSELAQQMCFPKHAVSGLPVIKCAEFGREIVSFDSPNKEKSEIKLGNIFHMYQEENQSVNLDANSFTSHVFITGSTGSGKSNTVYQILKEIVADKKTTEKNDSGKEVLKITKFKDDKHFLVIEPAKGEYKNVFGEYEKNVNVFGTNPNITPLLRLNPFSFDSEHILVHEHIDRLISIFNVCWPMYAAMPAVLKEAVEKSYIDTGWNLENPFAQNKFDNSFFPTFADVARNIRTIIDSSEYDAENKGAYKGSLLTRLKSLTNGINGMIFTNEEIGDGKLFDENTIVDLSRVGSAETKSLIMGILVLKLQEYRMSSGKMNSNLNHITVLEEAHNLLKRTSTDTSSESGNLQGRSVEMISNAIAEMRTYGEGFIIADQAPGLLDMAAIRNTNTKIIMRLPDMSDRELVGKAANLTEEQITELAKLPRGVAAVYQNEWVQSVLCKVAYYPTDDKPYEKAEEQTKGNEDLTKRGEIVQNLLRRQTVTLEELNLLRIDGSLKVAILNYQKTYEEYPVTIGIICAGLLPEAANKMEEMIAAKVNVDEWVDKLYDTLNVYFKEIENETVGKVIQSLIENAMYQDINNRQVLLNEFKDLYNKEAK